MDWKRKLKNFWSVKEDLEPHFKIKCLSNCLSGSNWTEERQDRFKEFYKIGWMAFQRIPLNPFPLIVGKRSQIGVIVLFFVDPACPGQGGLKEPSNGFLRKYDLPK